MNSVKNYYTAGLFLLLNGLLPFSITFAQSVENSNIKNISSTVTYSGEPIRLSKWLLDREKAGLSLADEYPLGLSWMTPEELKLQEAEYQTIKEKLDHLQQFKSWTFEISSRLSPERIEELKNKRNKSEQTYGRLKQVLDQLKPTGKVRTAAANAKWLEVNPKKDPVLRAGDKVFIPKRPATIRVMSANGSICEAPHKTGLHALDYVKACQTELNGAWAWIVQPDGRVIQVGLSMWNTSVQAEPAPGAWIWAPEWLSFIPEDFSQQWAKWLATQGVSTQIKTESFPLLFRQVQPADPPPLDFLKITDRQFDPKATASDWGYTGLLQTPSARLRGTGTFSTNIQSVKPYTIWNNFFQPFDWLETGFRYTAVKDVPYNTGDWSQTYKDKSIDLKGRVIAESDFLPAVAIGMRDIAGTGLFSSEYVVANKRIDRLDFSLGFATGELGKRGNIANPLGGSFSTRPTDTGGASTGGTFNPKIWFHGPGSLFGGVQFDTPIHNLILKAEYDGDNYQNIIGGPLVVKSPFNFGLIYSPASFVNLSLGLERGNTVSFGVTFYTDLSNVSMFKLADPTLPPVNTFRPTTQPNWNQTALDIQDQTQWRVNQIYQSQNTIVVDASQTLAPYPQPRVDKAMTIINRDAPEDIDIVKIENRSAGSVLATETIDRNEWIKTQTEPARTEKTVDPVRISYELNPTQGEPKLTEKVAPSFKLEPGLDFIETLQGPGSFLIYQFSAALNLEANLPYDFKVKGLERARLSNNYNIYNVPSNSALPAVRTNQQKYYTTSEYTLSNLSLINSQRLSENWYASGYVGYFEEMFGGVGAEVLYRKPGSVFATSVDFNRVFQRNFTQDLNFQDYRVNTGHVTQHWITPLDGVQVSLSYGQYLAGDRGATLAATKAFHNGVALKAYFSKTNVPYSVFGEGSFDKGIMISIPFDSFNISSSPFTGYFMWEPVVRDGGQMLHRPVDLYMEETRWVSPDVRAFGPAVPANAQLPPDDQLEPTSRLH